MTYLRPHNRGQGRTARLIGGSVAAMVIILAFLQWRMPYLLPQLSATIARPFWRAKFSVESGSLNSPEEVLAENETLKQDLAAVQANAASVDAVMAENAELLTLLGRSDAAADFALPGTFVASSTAPLSQSPALVPSPFTLAAVIERPPVSAYDELVIDIGEDHDVAPNDIVYAAGNVPIGQVAQALGQTSTVILLSSPGRTHSVLIGSGHAPATAVGRGGGQYQAELPRDTAVSAGDIVLAPLVNSKPLGVVSGVVSSPADPFETVLFSAPLDLYSLRWVLVDTASTTNQSVQAVPASRTRK